jgi:hypothetical protein
MTITDITGTIRKCIDPNNQEAKSKAPSYYVVENQVPSKSYSRDAEAYYRVRHLDGFTHELPESLIALDPIAEDNEIKKFARSS